MSERDIKRSLVYLVTRYMDSRLLNRLITYALINLAAYMLLLTILVLFNISLLLFHLLFSCSLSLLPFFLFYGLKEKAIQPSIRRIDERCQIEAFLSTSSREHRAYMQNRVESLLEKGKRERIDRVRLGLRNLYLAAACFGVFVVLQIVSFMILSSMTPSLNANNLKSTLVEIRTAHQNGEATDSEEIPITGQSPEAEQEDSVEGEAVEGMLDEGAEDLDFSSFWENQSR